MLSPPVQSSFWHIPEERPWGFYCRVDVEVMGLDGKCSVVMRDVAIHWDTLRSWGGVIPSGYTSVRVYPNRVVPYTHLLPFADPLPC